MEGAKCIGEVLKSRLKVERLFLTEQSTLSSPTAEPVSPKEMERIASLRTPSSELALVRIPAIKTSTASSDKLILALDDIQDTGNLGTIIRTADRFGIGSIVFSPQTADCYKSKGSAGNYGAL